MTTRGETLSQATVEPTEPPTEEAQPQGPIDHDNTEDTPDQQDCWDDANISRLIDLEAFRCSLHGYNQLLENSDSDDDDDEAIPRASGTNTESSSDKQPKLRHSPSMKG